LALRARIVLAAAGQLSNAAIAALPEKRLDGLAGESRPGRQR
jgi:hypothetical protein